MPRHCKSIPHEQVQFRAILVARSPTRYAHLSRKVAKGCDVLRLQYKNKSHSDWNCWNSVAVMFELRCSEFELGCSESAGQPQNAWGPAVPNPLSPTNLFGHQQHFWVFVYSAVDDL